VGRAIRNAACGTAENMSKAADTVVSVQFSDNGNGITVPSINDAH
jgi:hypothetical protein